MSDHWPYVWYWVSKLPERKRQPWRVIARGAMNNRLIEFEDGFKVVSSGNALRKRERGSDDNENQ